MEDAMVLLSCMSLVVRCQHFYLVRTVLALIDWDIHIINFVVIYMNATNLMETRCVFYELSDSLFYEITISFYIYLSLYVHSKIIQFINIILHWKSVGTTKSKWNAFVQKHYYDDYVGLIKLVALMHMIESTSENW